MRVLALPRYGPLGASSRLRMMQYIPHLRSAGIEVDAFALLDDDYVTRMYAGRVSAAAVVAAYARRLRRVLGSGGYDLLWVEKEIWPWLPASLELAALPTSTKLVVDYDDALFHRYDEHRFTLVRSLLGSKIDRVMRRADLVTGGNDYLAARARAAGGKRVEWLPTVVDMDRYPKPNARSPREEVVIGWIGSPSTAGYLRQLTPSLEALAGKDRIRFVAIGARPDQVEGTPFEAWTWREQDEVELLSALDIGLMPLPDAPWERGKCGYKLVQYMACGLPVVASPVGVNNQIVDVGRNGFLASSPAEWTEALDRLVADPQLRMEMGAAGRAQVEEVYSLQVQAPRLVALLGNVATRSHG